MPAGEGWFEGEVRSFDEVAAIAAHRKREIEKAKEVIMDKDIEIGLLLGKVARLEKQWKDPVACHDRYFELVALEGENQAN